MIPHLNHAPEIDDQFRYIVTSLSCAALPVLVIALLPDPLHTSLLPIAVLFGAYAIFSASALVLLALEKAWHMLRPAPRARLCCPACHTIDQPYRPFYVTRIAVNLMRVHCPECHERWIERARS